jgi:hypothetical protein
MGRTRWRNVAARDSKPPLDWDLRLALPFHLEAVGEHSHHDSAAGFLFDVLFLHVRHDALPDFLLRQKE